MVRYFLKFSYIGTQYRGVQKQVSSSYVRNTDTVQGALESALLNILPKPTVTPSIILSSRTDAGVHAFCNTAHVEIENKYKILYNPNNIKKFVNRYFKKCGHTVRLLEWIPVTPDFHARKSCKSRTYIYRFMIPKQPDEEKLPLIDLEYTHFVRAHDFDIDRVRCGTELFMGVKDFTTFSAESIGQQGIVYVRSLHAFTLEETQSLVPFDPLSKNFRYFQFVCKARSFLYNQVRRMVGALVALGQKKITEKDITFMFEVPSHLNWNTHISSVPSMGLHLLNLEYDEEELRHCTISDERYEEMQLEEQKLIAQKMQFEDQNRDLLLKKQKLLELLELLKKQKQELA